MSSLTSTARVFVVDDEEVIASTLARILDLNGFSARWFTLPTEALAASQSDIPDLLISDVSMPDLSGIDLAIQMKMDHPKCKMLLFSGQPHTSDLLEAARHQGFEFPLLIKPVSPSELLAEIRKIRAESDKPSAPNSLHPAVARDDSPQTTRQ